MGTKNTKLKKVIVMLFLIGVFLLMCGCVRNNRTGINKKDDTLQNVNAAAERSKITRIVLEADKNEINSDGEELVTFHIDAFDQDDHEIADTQAEFFCNGNKLTKNEFSTKEPGKYEIYAVLEGIKSDVIEVIAKEGKRVLAQRKDTSISWDPDTNEENAHEDLHVYEYDNLGNLIENAFYDANPNISRKTRYEYDEEGYLIKEIHESYGFHARVVTSEYKYEVKDDGRLITYREGPRISIFEFNDQMKKVKTIHEDQSGIMDEMIYDDRGNTIKQTVWIKGNKIPSAVREYHFNEHGDMVKLLETRGKTKRAPLAWRYDYKFDNIGRVIQKVEKTGGFLDTTIYTYDEQGRIVEEVKKNNTGYTGITERTYDSYGNITKIIEKNKYDKENASSAHTEEYFYKTIYVNQFKKHLPASVEVVTNHIIERDGRILPR